MKKESAITVRGTHIPKGFIICIIFGGILGYIFLDELIFYHALTKIFFGVQIGAILHFCVVSFVGLFG